MLAIRPAPEGPWTQDDVQWFKENDRKHWRVRDPSPGEMESLFEYGDDFQRRSIQSLNEAALRLDVKQDTFRIIVFQLRPGQRYRIPLLGPRTPTDEVIFFDPNTSEPITAETMYAQLKSFFFRETTLCTRCGREISTGDLMFITQYDQEKVSCITCARCVLDQKQHLKLLSAAVHIEPKHEKIPRHRWPKNLRMIYEKNERIIKGIYQSETVD